jgi:hypothetical protein
VFVQMAANILVSHLSEEGEGTIEESDVVVRLEGER